MGEGVAVSVQTIVLVLVVVAFSAHEVAGGGGGQGEVIVTTGATEVEWCILQGHCSVIVFVTGRVWLWVEVWQPKVPLQWVTVKQVVVKSVIVRVM